MGKLNVRPRAIPYGSRIVQNIVRARTAYLAITKGSVGDFHVTKAF